LGREKARYDVSSPIERYETDMLSVADALRLQMEEARSKPEAEVAWYETGVWSDYMASCRAIYDAYAATVIASLEKGEAHEEDGQAQNYAG
jgi:hypothetical protein